jgi:hypothetical protein
MATVRMRRWLVMSEQFVLRGGGQLWCGARLFKNGNERNERDTATSKTKTSESRRKNEIVSGSATSENRSGGDGKEEEEAEKDEKKGIQMAASFR